jgi:hypothetical protein
MAVELFFHFNCLGFKPVAIEMKKSGNVQHDPKFFTKGHAQREDSSIQMAVFRWQTSDGRLQMADFRWQFSKYKLQPSKKSIIILQLHPIVLIIQNIEPIFSILIIMNTNTK